MVDMKEQPKPLPENASINKTELDDNGLSPTGKSDAEFYMEMMVCLNNDFL